MPTLPLYSVWLLIGLAFLLAAFISAGGALIADYLDPSFRTPDEVKKFLDIPVFASIPENGHDVHEVHLGSFPSESH
jgi:capsular polysaccharide biosynthesis protein